MTAPQPLPSEAVLIVNAHSRKGAAAFDEARDSLAAAGVKLLAAHRIEDPAEIDSLVRQAVAQAPMVIVGGGDGSLASAIDHFLGSDTIFALLPLGTANSFARSLNIPLDLAGAVAVIAEGEARRIDLGRIDDDYFVNSATMGLAPLIAETVPHSLKQWLGKLSYPLWGARLAASFRPFRLTVEDGSQVHRLWTTEVRIANGRHVGGVELVEAAELDSGEIVIQAVSGKGLARLAWSWFGTLLKLPHRHQTVVEFHGREFRLDARPRQKIAIDGELAAKTPVTVRIARAAAWVAAPREQPSTPA